MASDNKYRKTLIACVFPIVLIGTIIGIKIKTKS